MWGFYAKATAFNRICSMFWKNKLEQKKTTVNFQSLYDISSWKFIYNKINTKAPEGPLSKNYQFYKCSLRKL